MGVLAFRVPPADQLGVPINAVVSSPQGRPATSLMRDSWWLFKRGAGAVYEGVRRTRFGLGLNEQQCRLRRAARWAPGQKYNAAGAAVANF